MPNPTTLAVVFFDIKEPRYGLTTIETTRTSGRELPIKWLIHGNKYLCKRYSTHYLILRLERYTLRIFSGFQKQLFLLDFPSHNEDTDFNNYFWPCSRMTGSNFPVGNPHLPDLICGRNWNRLDTGLWKTFLCKTRLRPILRLSWRRTGAALRYGVSSYASQACRG